MNSPLQEDIFDHTKSAFQNFNPTVVKQYTLADIEEQDLLGLAGAPNGSNVYLDGRFREIYVPREASDPDWTGEIVPHGLVLTVVNGEFLSEPNVVIVTPVRKGFVDVYVAMVKFIKTYDSENRLRNKMAAKMIRAIVQAADRTREKGLIVGNIYLMAAGGRQWGDIPNQPGKRWIGYTAWPKAGFDMRLNDQIHGPVFAQFPHVPGGLKDCNTVQDVLQLESGDAFWTLAGDGLRMAFDLSEESRSREILGSYLGRIENER